MRSSSSAPRPAPETARGPGATSTSPPHAAALTQRAGMPDSGEACGPDTRMPGTVRAPRPPARGAWTDRNPLPLLDTIHAMLRCVAAGEHHRQTGRLPGWAQ